MPKPDSLDTKLDRLEADIQRLINCVGEVSDKNVSAAQVLDGRISQLEKTLSAAHQAVEAIHKRVTALESESRSEPAAEPQWSPERDEREWSDPSLFDLTYGLRFDAAECAINNLAVKVNYLARNTDLLAETTALMTLHARNSILTLNARIPAPPN